MEGLAGTIHTPMGNVSKQTALIGGGAVLILGVLYYRSKKQSAADAVAASGQSEINPATGYPFGSPEDAAAMQHQGEYQMPGSGGGGGSPGYPAGSVGFISNGQWTQAVIEYFVAHDIVTNAGMLTEALGAYVTGAPVTKDQESLIHQAIAAEGYPPSAGPTGYPPSINTTPTTSPTPTPTPTPTTTPTVAVQMTATVKKGWHVDEWINDVRRTPGMNPNFSWDLLEAHNPGVSKNVNWVNPSSARTFKQAATYRINW